MADDAEVKLRPDGPLAKYLSEHRSWTETKKVHERTEPTAPRCSLDTAYAKFCEIGDEVNLKVEKFTRHNFYGSGNYGKDFVFLSFAEAERLRVWLNEVMG